MRWLMVRTAEAPRHLYVTEGASVQREEWLDLGGPGGRAPCFPSATPSVDGRLYADSLPDFFYYYYYSPASLEISGSFPRSCPGDWPCPPKKSMQGLGLVSGSGWVRAARPVCPILTGGAAPGTTPGPQGALSPPRALLLAGLVFSWCSVQWCHGSVSTALGGVALCPWPFLWPQGLGVCWV